MSNIFIWTLQWQVAKYMSIKLGKITERMVQKYKLEAKATKVGYVHAEIRRGMYNLPYAGIIEQQLLDKSLNKKGYRQSDIAPGFWTQ